VSRCASCCLIDLQQLQYNLSMFVCLSWIVPFFLFNIDVAIMTQQYLSFQRILKRSAFASHSFCIENIVGLIILDLPIKLPKAGKLLSLYLFQGSCFYLNLTIFQRILNWSALQFPLFCRQLRMPELEDCDDVVADLLMVILPQNRGSLHVQWLSCYSASSVWFL